MVLTSTWWTVPLTGYTFIRYDKIPAMAVTLTLEQLADHLRIERAAIASGDPRRTILVELLQVGEWLVEMYAPLAPNDVQNLAVARYAGYIYDSPPASAGAPYATSFVNSGALHIISPWRSGRADLVPAVTPGAAAAAVVPEPEPEPAGPLFFLGWTRYRPATGFTVDAAEGAAIAISQTDFDNAARADNYGPLTWPAAHFVANPVLGWGFYWIAVERGKGEPPGGIANNGVWQGTGLTPNDTMGFHDPATMVELEFYLWPVALNIGLIGNGTFALTLLGYPA